MSCWVTRSLDQSAGLIVCSAILESRRTSSFSVAGKTEWEMFQKKTLKKFSVEVFSVS